MSHPTLERVWCESRDAVRPVLAIWLAVQASVACVLVLAASISGERILHTWALWDAGWFARVAESGYRDGLGTPAFYPLFPALMRVASELPGVGLYLGGVLVSLVASLAAFALLYRLAADLFDESVARRSVIYLGVFPTVVFLQLPYSESLFLAFAIGVFLAAEHGRLVTAGALAGCALLTRPVGFALLAAIALFALRDRRFRGGIAAIGIAIALFGLYPLWLVHDGRSALAFLHAEAAWERHRSSLGPIGGVLDGMRAAWGGILQLTWGPNKPYWSTFHSDHQALVNLSGLLALGIAAVLVAATAFRLSRPYLAYVVVAVVMPLSVPSDPRPLQSMSRFCLVLFPGLIGLASLPLTQKAHAIVWSVSGTLAVTVTAWWASGWFVA